MYQTELPTLDIDVAVVGAGSAGCTPTIADGRAGTSVLLFERHGFLGGTSTAVLDAFYGFYTPGEAAEVVDGISDDVTTGLCALGRVILEPDAASNRRSTG
jgi:flavin-dependent dehydrogenase